MAKKNRLGNLESLYEDTPFKVETANGTGHAMGTGWNRRDYKWDQEQAEPGGPWPSGRSNRTAE